MYQSGKYVYNEDGTIAFEARSEREAHTFVMKAEWRPDALYGLVTRVSRSGMTRHIRIFEVLDGHIMDVTWRVAELLVFNRDEEDGIEVQGAGMDMVAWLIMHVSGILYGDDYKINIRRL